MASSSARSRCTLRTRMGPSVTFWSTVRCGNRLNDWNTMPISLRTAAMLRMSLDSSMPSTTMSPRWCSSSRLMVRMNVDLPEPDGPAMTSDLAGWTVRSMPRRTCSWPNHLWTSRQTMMVVGGVSPSGRSPRVSTRSSLTHAQLPLETIARLREGVAEDEEHDGDEGVDLERCAQPLRLGEHGAADAEDLEQRRR